MCFGIWPDFGSIEKKHVVEFLVLITIYIVVLLTGINTLYIYIYIGKGKGKLNPLQVRCGPEGG
jgi:hypothetical protein